MSRSASYPFTHANKNKSGKIYQNRYTTVKFTLGLGTSIIYTKVTLSKSTKIEVGFKLDKK